MEIHGTARSCGRFLVFGTPDFFFYAKLLGLFGCSNLEVYVFPLKK